MSDGPEIESKTDYDDTPQGLQKRWGMEISQAKKNQAEFWEQGDEATKEFLGEGGDERLNLWYSDVNTKSSTLSGKPKVRARRRHADARDKVARVSADMLERLLNTDVERDSDGYRKALGNARGDYLRAGLGVLRFRYVVKEDENGVKTFEDVETGHINWKDYLWSPCRTYEERRWEAFALEMSRDALHRRFDDVLGADMVNQIPLTSGDEPKSSDDARANDPWKRARVWEIWDKETKRKLWLVEGFEVILDVQDDALGLPNFFPAPEPLAATLTSSKWMPKPVYFLAKPQYQEAHRLTARIRALVAAIKIVGAYQKGNEAITKILDQACENQFVSVESISALMGDGDQPAPVWIMPIEPQVKALVELVQQRNLVRADIAEVLGLSDIMRGQQAQRVTATTDRIKARAFSMRQQTEQDEFARFASDAQRIRAFIIAKMFDPKTIVERSNIRQAVEDEALIAKAVELLKSDIAAYRIDVDGESLSMRDFDAVRQERTEALTALATLKKESIPFIQMAAAVGPKAAMAAVKLMTDEARWLLAGLPGTDGLEEAFDRFVATLEEVAAEAANAPPPPPDPMAEAKVKEAQIGLQTKVVEAQARSQQAQADMAKTKLDLQSKVVEHGLKAREMQQKAELSQQQMQQQAVAGQQQREVDQENFGMRMAEMQAKRAAAEDMPEMEAE